MRAFEAFAAESGDEPTAGIPRAQITKTAVWPGLADHAAVFVIWCLRVFRDQGQAGVRTARAVAASLTARSLTIRSLYPGSTLRPGRWGRRPWWRTGTVVGPLVFRHGTAETAFAVAVAAWAAFEFVMRVRQRLQSKGPASVDRSAFVLVPCLAGAVIVAELLGHRGGLPWPGGCSGRSSRAWC
jgi:hypothetical protein